jgi:hypothetical protein
MYLALYIMCVDKHCTYKLLIFHMLYIIQAKNNISIDISISVLNTSLYLLFYAL